MDPARFDAFARAAARGSSRRRVLGGLAAVALSPLTAVATPAPAACLAVGKRCSQPASAGHAKGKKGKKGKPPSCSKCCSRFGAADSNGKARCTCKGEAVPCANDSECCGGQCRQSACTGCPAGTDFCTDGCADLETNNQHCGSCDVACAAGQRCVNRQCVCDATSCPTGCCDGTTCKRGTSLSACGDNGATCAICLAGETCDGDACVCASGVICSVSGCCSSADQVCDQNDECCTPDCTGKVCGADDGCGGTCGCPNGQTCRHGGCFLPCGSDNTCTACGGASCGCGAAERLCQDKATGLGVCTSDADCPIGALCSAFRNGSGQQLCTQPCPGCAGA